LIDDSTARSARGVYGTAVASELSGLGAQTLRLYEKRGLLTPARTSGGTRRYSDDDLERLQRIAELIDQGVNLAGIAQILDLETKNSQLQAGYTALELLNAKLRAERKPAAGRSAGGNNEGRSSDHEGRRERRSTRRNT
jgi:MerR family transcriptional regulator/heat shock protein HspR